MEGLWLLFFFPMFVIGFIGLIKFDDVVNLYIKIGYTYLNSSGRRPQPEWWIRYNIRLCLILFTLIGLVYTVNLISIVFESFT